MNWGMRVLQTLALPLGYVTVWKKEQNHCSFFICGAGDEARTRYLHLGKVALYQMSYARKWCLRPESNWRHADFQSAALPTELPRHMATKKGLEPSTSSVTGWRSNQLNYLAMCAFVLELKLAYYSKYRAECQHPFPVFPAIFSEGGG